MADFDPDAYLAKKSNGFDPDAYLAKKAAPREVLHGADAIPREPGAAPRSASQKPEDSIIDQIIGGAQAGLNTAASLTGGAAGMIYGGLEGIGESAEGAIRGKQIGPGIEQRMTQRARQFTPELPKSVQTPLGQEYTENFGDTLATHGASVAGLGPELGVLGNSMHQLKPPPIMDTVGGALKSGARRTMQSALKPTWESLHTGDAGKAIDTMLDRGYNVSPGGAAKMQFRISELNGKIADMVEKSPAIIDKKAAMSTMKDVLKKFEDQVNPNTDIVAIQKAFDEFENHPRLAGNDIPVKYAQTLKKGTYQHLGDKAYSGELKTADIDAQKAIARGLKEQIAKSIPEVSPLNAEESELLNAMSVSERRVLMEANKNPMGLSLLTTSPKKMAAFMADRSGLFKSIVARMLNTTAEKLMSKPEPKAAPADKLNWPPTGMRLVDDGHIPNAPRQGGIPLPPSSAALADTMTSSLGAGGGRARGGYEPGLHRSVGEEPPLPQGMPPPRPGSQIPLARHAPLGDLTPDWGTQLGAGGRARGGIDPHSPRLIPALGDVRYPGGPKRNAAGKLEMPKVEGHPADASITEAADRLRALRAWKKAHPGEIPPPPR